MTSIIVLLSFLCPFVVDLLKEGKYVYKLKKTYLIMLCNIFFLQDLVSILLILSMTDGEDSGNWCSWFLQCSWIYEGVLISPFGIKCHRSWNENMSCYIPDISVIIWLWWRSLCCVIGYNMSIGLSFVGNNRLCIFANRFILHAHWMIIKSSWYYNVN